MTRQDAVERLRASLERGARRRSSMPPPQVLVVSPRLELESGGAQPFHAASVGKVMTATLVATLVEQGRFRFGTPVGKLLPGADLDGLPVAPGVDVRTDVTLEHLLTHTSGLPDYFEPPRGTSTGVSVRTAAADPDRYWSPAALLDEARRLPAVGRPGERFRYGDTVYVLMGRIVEEATGEPFDAALRDRVLGPSGMERSSTPYGDARTPADLDGLDVAPFWLGRHELSHALSMSLDWAGGGIVAPPADLVRFQQALHGGRLISRDTLRWMTTPRRRRRRGIHYGAGIVTVRFGEFTPPFLRGLPEPVGGLGHFATHMFFYPRQDAHVVLNFHAYRRMNQSFALHARIARLLAES
ncbi:serine hydrolase domain-containing protein [Krasilnikoviella flava]|uniref:D-alanyl-D-alanine carboxypeptidase n=1 Tax=Krasilnikoviella flava TaxID=526729 RepID=A0A1T5IQE4_9MICO|nr:serine hydrolase domain-containing protein [Krasilnikoviella flava]SKC41376.1 D-alanyl-D-alanine carboxypeptidase [Krasilnikoviella flava]